MKFLCLIFLFFSIYTEVTGDVSLKRNSSIEDSEVTVILSDDNDDTVSHDLRSKKKDNVNAKRSNSKQKCYENFQEINPEKKSLESTELTAEKKSLESTELTAQIFDQLENMEKKTKKLLKLRKKQNQSKSVFNGKQSVYGTDSRPSLTGADKQHVSLVDGNIKALAELGGTGKIPKLPFYVQEAVAEEVTLPDTENKDDTIYVNTKVKPQEVYNQKKSKICSEITTSKKQKRDIEETSGETSVQDDPHHEETLLHSSVNGENDMLDEESGSVDEDSGSVGNTVNKLEKLIYDNKHKIFSNQNRFHTYGSQRSIFENNILKNNEITNVNFANRDHDFDEENDYESGYTEEELERGVEQESNDFQYNDNKDDSLILPENTEANKIIDSNMNIKINNYLTNLAQYQNERDANNDYLSYNEDKVLNQLVNRDKDKMINQLSKHVKKDGTIYEIQSNRDVETIENEQNLNHDNEVYYIANEENNNIASFVPSRFMSNNSLIENEIVVDEDGSAVEEVADLDFSTQEDLTKSNKFVKSMKTVKNKLNKPRLINSSSLVKQKNKKILFSGVIRNKKAQDQKLLPNSSYFYNKPTTTKAATEFLNSSKSWPFRIIHTKIKKQENDLEVGHQNIKHKKTNKKTNKKVQSSIKGKNSKNVLRLNENSKKNEKMQQKKKEKYKKNKNKKIKEKFLKKSKKHEEIINKSVNKKQKQSKSKKQRKSKSNHLKAPVTPARLKTHTENKFKEQKKDKNKKDQKTINNDQARQKKINNDRADHKKVNNDKKISNEKKYNNKENNDKNENDEYANENIKSDRKNNDKKGVQLNKNVKNMDNRKGNDTNRNGNELKKEENNKGKTYQQHNNTTKKKKEEEDKIAKTGTLTKLKSSHNSSNNENKAGKNDHNQTDDNKYEEKVMNLGKLIIEKSDKLKKNESEAHENKNKNNKNKKVKTDSSMRDDPPVYNQDNLRHLLAHNQKRTIALRKAQKIKSFRTKKIQNPVLPKPRGIITEPDPEAYLKNAISILDRETRKLNNNIRIVRDKNNKGMLLLRDSQHFVPIYTNSKHLKKKDVAPQNLIPQNSLLKTLDDEATKLYKWANDVMKNI
ncbi:putative mediator of RNA polymerase II transcription subunit 24 [Hydra vulgaris]|uniref:putative mediator of RNA polymerase II transcription subunit 24 n=1 Tax=Hydra vulgaris TaxID=6087 RepID=UPI001F5E531C|nr:putative mediator of RNA polymerase II transcription subunit 24 [Hydra vulgaris]